MEIDKRYFEVDIRTLRLEEGRIRGTTFNNVDCILIAAASNLLRNDLEDRVVRAKRLGQPYTELPRHSEIGLDVGVDQIRDVIEKRKGELGMLKKEGECVLGPLVARLRDETEYQPIMDDYGIYEVDKPNNGG